MRTNPKLAEEFASLDIDPPAEVISLQCAGRTADANLRADELLQHDPGYPRRQWAELYPLLAEALDLGKISVGPPYFGLLFGLPGQHGIGKVILPAEDDEHGQHDGEDGQQRPGGNVRVELAHDDQRAAVPADDQRLFGFCNRLGTLRHQRAVDRR